MSSGVTASLEVYTTIQWFPKVHCDPLVGHNEHVLWVKELGPPAHPCAGLVPILEPNNSGS